MIFMLSLREGGYFQSGSDGNVKSRPLFQPGEAHLGADLLLLPLKQSHRSLVFKVLESQFPCKHLKSVTSPNTYIIVVAGCFLNFSTLECFLIQKYKKK